LPPEDGMRHAQRLLTSHQVHTNIFTLPEGNWVPYFRASKTLAMNRQFHKFIQNKNSVT